MTTTLTEKNDKKNRKICAQNILSESYEFLPIQNLSEFQGNWKLT